MQERTLLRNAYVGYKLLNIGWEPQKSLKERFVEEMKNLVDGSYLIITHPVYRYEELKNFKPARQHQNLLADFVSKRDEERKFLCDDELIKMMEKKIFESIRFLDT